MNISRISFASNSQPLRLFFLLIFLLPTIPLFSQVNSVLVIGDNVRMRSTPSLSGKVVGEVNYWDMAAVHQKTEEHYTLEEGKMESGWGWSWYEIETLEGKRGWVYGQFLAENPGKALFSNEHFQTGLTVLQDEEYVLQSAASKWYDEPVDDGPYFDEDRTIYYFTSGSKVFPILDNEAPLILSNWGSGKPDCLYANAKKSMLVLAFTFDYMDGSEKVLYTLQWAGDRFIVKDQFTSGVL